MTIFHVLFTNETWQGNESKLILKTKENHVGYSNTHILFKVVHNN